jgi:hypothetical protein
VNAAELTRTAPFHDAGGLAGGMEGHVASESERRNLPALQKSATTPFN